MKGYYGDSSGLTSSSCSGECSAGTYSSSIGSSECISCGAG